MKQLALFILAATLMVSCKKSEEVKEAETGAFVINGVKDVDLSESSDGRYSFPASVSSTTGSKDTVKLVAELVPGGVYCSFSVNTGVTPFNSVVTVSTDFSTPGGTYPFKIKGIGKTGNRSYDIKVTLAPFRGWQLDSDIYEKEVVSKTEGASGSYPYVIATSPNGSQLRIAFAANTKLPKVNTTYKVSRDTGKNNIQITVFDNQQIWSATGLRTDNNESASGVFSFDTLKRFTFKASNLEVSDGLKKKNLNISFSE